jgi:hypothetical protein
MNNPNASSRRSSFFSIRSAARDVRSSGGQFLHGLVQHRDEAGEVEDLPGIWMLSSVVLRPRDQEHACAATGRSKIFGDELLRDRPIQIRARIVREMARHD